MWHGGTNYEWATRPAGAAAFGDVHTVTLPAGEQPRLSSRSRMSPAGTPSR